MKIPVVESDRSEGRQHREADVLVGCFAECIEHIRRRFRHGQDQPSRVPPPHGVPRRLAHPRPHLVDGRQLGRRARAVIPRLFAEETIGDEPFDPPERLAARFLKWAANADGQKLATAVQVMTSEGGQIVQGRSRGAGKRSRLRAEPIIMGKVRGTGATRHRGGRPRNKGRENLVMHLAMDWLNATGEAPKHGRSDRTGFGDLAYSVFQWLNLPEGSAPYALRQYRVNLERQ